MKNIAFASLFRKYRLRSEFQTLSAFGEALYENGIIFDDSLFSHWQKGDRVPDRRTILALIRIFHKKKAIAELEEANSFMESAGHGYLTNSERKILFDETIKPQEDSDDLLKIIEYSFNPLGLIEEQVDQCLEAYYLGFARFSYKNLTQLAKLVETLRLNQTKEGINVLSHIYWLQLACLSNQVDPKRLTKLSLLSDQTILFAKENTTTELGQAYYVKYKIKRYGLITNLVGKKLIKKQINECISLAELSLFHIPKTRVVERLIAQYGFAKLALFSRDKKLFDKHLFSAFNLFAQLPQNMQFLKIPPWAIKALGCIRFDEDVISALKNIQIALNFNTRHYRLLNLFCHVNKLHILRSSKDPQHHALADKLEDQTIIQNNMIGDSFENMRMREKRMIGLA
ncbi:hypothetical protein HY357_04015 [Candidatus Roizmanbacteria bacterium]|nr:hypothetical protein [Candidatus Roizmanbacteria bacterium]